MSESSQAVAKREENQNPQEQALQLIASQETPTDAVKWRKGRGGREYPYTNTAYVIRKLNDAFAWDWDFECDQEEVILRGDQPFEIKVRGKLTIRAGGRVITKVQYGCQPIEGGEKAPSIGDCYKGAASDALKKCASMIGIALDLYDSDSDVHEGGKAPALPSGQGETEAEKRMRIAKEKAGKHLTVAGSQGPSKDLMRNPKYSAATGEKLGKACQRLVAYGVTGEELLRELNFALTSFGKDAVQTRYELDDESALQIADSFNEWADVLDRKAKTG